MLRFFRMTGKLGGGFEHMRRRSYSASGVHLWSLLEVADKTGYQFQSIMFQLTNEAPNNSLVVCRQPDIFLFNLNTPNVAEGSKDTLHTRMCTLGARVEPYVIPATTADDFISKHEAQLEEVGSEMLGVLYMESLCKHLREQRGWT